MTYPILMQNASENTLLRLLITQAPSAIALLDRNMRYLIVSQQWLQDYELGQEIIGCCYYDFLANSSDSERATHQACLETATEASIEVPLQQANGNLIWLNNKIRPWTDTTGAIGGLIISSEKITYSKQTEANSQQLLSAVREIALNSSADQQTEVTLQQTKEQLETQIRLRTAVLEQTIKQLEQEILERQFAIRELTITEKKFRSSEAELRALFNAMTDVVLVVDAQGRCLKVAPTNPSQLQKKVQEIVGKTLHESFPQAQASQFLEYIQETLRTQQTTHFEYSFKVGDRVLWFDGSLSPLKNDQVIWIGRDVTARKHIEEDLREQAQLSLLRAELDFSVTKIDDFARMLQRSTEIIVHSLDAAFARIWILNPEENILELQASAGIYTHLDGAHSRVPVGQFKIGLIAEERQPHLTNAVLEDPRVGDKEWAKREGMIAFAGYPLIVEEQLLGVIALFSRKPLTDSTLKALALVASELALGIKHKQGEVALQHSEAQLRQQAQALEIALRDLQQTQTQLVQTEKMSSLGQLVAGVAHEINNPVNFIHGNVAHANAHTQDLLNFLQLYQKHYPNPVAEIQAEAEAIDLDFLLEDLPKTLSSMKVGTQRIQKIVLALRNFSRTDEIEQKPVDIHEGIDSTLMILQNRLKETSNYCGIKVIRDYGDLPVVECSAGQLNQVFMNILANAIDALESISPDQIADNIRQPTIRIRTQVVEDRWAQISIADNGPGIPEPARARLFEPFFTTKPIGKGTGLGLSISYQVVVERHGGTLNCISTPNQGTEFLIKIPISRTSDR